MMTRTEASARALVALEGLSVGDAFGESNLAATPETRARVEGRLLAARTPWRWTDDTAMALAIVDTLDTHGEVAEDALAAAFATRYHAEPGRGYGAGAHRILTQIGLGVPWRRAAGAAFGGQGSAGNGGGMRAAPIGAWFASDLDRAAREAARSAAPTHAHPDGGAGAVAIAVAAAAVFAGERDPAAILAAVIDRTPAGRVKDGLGRVARVGDDRHRAAEVLGNGSQVLAADTVPFAIWCALRFLGDYEAALWCCCDVGGDIDTTCAMVGGIVVGATGLAGIPVLWRHAREPLPPGFAWTSERAGSL
jgi:ADP-ribosylglycohydrolase